MAEKLAKFFVGIFGGITSTLMGKYLVIFIISLIPILELRGGLIAASLLDLPMWTSYLICFIGNIIPIIDTNAPNTFPIGASPLIIASKLFPASTPKYAP